MQCGAVRTPSHSVTGNNDAFPLSHTVLSSEKLSEETVPLVATHSCLNQSASKNIIKLKNYECVPK